jgi:chromosome segregation ATPase
MSRSQKIVGVLIVSVFGIWGCSRTPSAESAATAEKLKSVETKLARLEDDFRAVASARDQLSKKLLAAEEARTALLAQVETLHKDLKSKEDLVQNRTSERDQANVQLKSLKDGLKDLLTKMDDGPKPDATPAVSVIPTSNPKVK